MRIELISGVCGLALSGLALGELKLDPSDTSRYISAAELEAYRLSRSEGVNRNVPRRSLAGSAARGGIYELHDLFDGIDPDGMLPNPPGQYLRLTDLAPVSGSILNGQLGVDSQAVTSISWGGIVDNAVALSNMDGDPGNGEYNGPVGGPDPMGTRGGMLHVQGGSVNRDSTGSGGGAFTYQYPHNLYTGTSSRPIFFEIDIYKPAHDTFQWIRAMSFTEGSIFMNVQMGGWNGPGSGLFEPLAQRYGDPELLEGVTVLANVPGDPDSGEFVTGPYQIPEHGWYTLGVLMDPATGMAYFVRDSVTTVDTNMDGTPDYVMPQNTATGLRMFEEFGYGLEEGWVQVIPGTDDDPMTVDEIEGVGRALNGDMEETDNLVVNGNRVASVFASISVDNPQLIHGNDPSAAELPGYEIADWWYDEYRIRGVEFPFDSLDLPDYVIPYADDLERWNLGTMALQGGRWFVRSLASQVLENQNHTVGIGSDGDTATQSLALLNTDQSNVFERTISTNLPTTPRVRGQAGDPAVVQASVRFESSFVSYGIGATRGSGFRSTNSFSTLQPEGADTGESMARVWTSCVDALGVVDGLVYVRQRKPIGSNIASGEFDPLQPLVPTAGPHLTPDQEATINTEYINVRAAPAGMTGLTLPTDQWHTFSIESEPGNGSVGTNGESHIVRVYVNINDGPRTELFPNGDDTKRFSTNEIAPKVLRFASSNSLAGGYQFFYVDDVHFSGPTQTDTLVPLVPEFTNDSPWELPFSDSFDSYEKNRPATPQGFANHRIGFMPIADPNTFGVSDWDEIELIDGAPPLTNGDAVRVYEVTSIEHGSPPFSFADFVAVSDDVFREYDPDFDIYGVTLAQGSPTEWYILDAVGGTELSRGTWVLAVDTGLLTFDDMTMVDMSARYSYRQEFRYTGEEYENEFVSAADEGIDTARGESRGDVVKFTNKGNVRDYSDPNGGQRNNTVDLFSALLPLAQAKKPEVDPTLSFDMYVGQSTFATGMWAEINGGTADGGRITALSFGGDGLQNGNRDEKTLLNPHLPLGNFGYLIKNPAASPGNPDALWVDTGIAVPTEQWFTVSVSINSDAEYTLRIDGTIIASGTAIDVGNSQFNTTSLDNVSFIRNQWGENDGEPTEGVVQLTVRDPMALAPLTGEVGPYHFFEINTIDELNSTNIPQVIAVDPETGDPLEDAMMTPLPPRDLKSRDVIAVVNFDPATMSPVPHPLVNDRWEVIEDDGMGGSVTVASGDWFPRGLPGFDGLGDNAAPAGGVTSGATPAYNADAPFKNILLADYVSIPTNTVLPSDVWYIDNLSLVIEDNSCPADLAPFTSGDGMVDSADLAVLLAAWGSNPGHVADIAPGPSGDGVIDSADLAVLLAAWGICD